LDEGEGNPELAVLRTLVLLAYETVLDWSPDLGLWDKEKLNVDERLDDGMREVVVWFAGWVNGGGVYTGPLGDDVDEFGNSTGVVEEDRIMPELDCPVPVNALRLKKVPVWIGTEEFPYPLNPEAELLSCPPVRGKPVLVTDRLLLIPVALMFQLLLAPVSIMLPTPPVPQVVCVLPVTTSTLVSMTVLALNKIEVALLATDDAEATETPPVPAHVS
jgi:hypothetical protein